MASNVTTAQSAASCIPGDLIDAFLAEAMIFAQTYFGSVAGFCHKVFASIVLLWMVWMIGKKAAGGTVDKEMFFTQLVIFAIAEATLLTGEYLWAFVDVFLSSGIWAAATAIDISAPTTTNIRTVGDLTCFVGDAFDLRIFVAVREMVSEWSITNLSNFIPISLITILSFLVFYKVFGNIFRAIFTIIVISILSPFIVLFSLSVEMRKVVLTAFKIMLSSVFTLITVCGVAGILITIITSAVYGVSAAVPLSPDGSELLDTSNFLLSDRYWKITVAMALFWISFDAIVGTVQSLLEVVASQASGMINKFL